MARLAYSSVPLLLLALGACSDLPPEVETTTGASTGATDATTTMPTITADGGTQTDGVGTQGASGGTTNGSATTLDVDTTAAPDDTTSGSSGPPPGCLNPEDCPANETCNEGTCESVCPGGWAAAGNYAYCLDEWGGFDVSGSCGGDAPAHRCLSANDPINGVSCSVQNCSTVCDCPAPPPTGDALVACGAFEAEGPADCFLDCSGGRTCPDGMECNDDVCMHPPQPLSMYGNCRNVDAPCAEGECRDYSSGMNDFAMCVDGCGNSGDCTPAVTGSDESAQCGGVLSPPLGLECYIPCDDSGDCASPMVCVNGSSGTELCIWPA